MPFSQVAGPIRGIGNHLRQTSNARWQDIFVVGAMRLMRPGPGQQRGPRGRTNRMRYVGALENYRFRREEVQAWRAHAVRSTSDNQVGPKFIGKKDQEIRFTGGRSFCRNGECGGAQRYRAQERAARDFSHATTTNRSRSTSR